MKRKPKKKRASKPLMINLPPDMLRVGQEIAGIAGLPLSDVVTVILAVRIWGEVRSGARTIKRRK